MVYFSPLSIAILSLGKKELVFVLFVRLFDLYLVLSVSSSSRCLGRAAVCDCWYFLDFSLTFVCLKDSLPLTDNIFHYEKYYH